MSKKIALVTGGSRGIGLAISRRLVDSGVHVAAVYRSDAASARALVEEAGPKAGSVSVHQADLGVPDECRAVVEDVLAEHGRIDHVVNNAGLLIENKIGDISDDEWSQVIDANLGSAFHVARAAWQPMVDQGFGRIVNVGSVTATSGNPVEAAYGSAKAGIIGLTRSLAMAGARKGITVNCVVPGVFDTDMTRDMDERDRERIAKLIPLGRLGRTAEFAHMVCSLLADEAAYVTGAVIMVDGGLGMGA